VRKFLEANGVKPKVEKEPKPKAEVTPIKKVAG
jgi:hypothetical protein